MGDLRGSDVLGSAVVRGGGVEDRVGGLHASAALHGVEQLVAFLALHEHVDGGAAGHLAAPVHAAGDAALAANAGHLLVARKCAAEIAAVVLPNALVAVKNNK